MAKKGDKSFSEKKAKSLTYKKRFNLSLSSFLISAILSVFMRIVYLYSESPLYQNTFYFLFMIFFFLALAFLVAFVAILFSKKRKKSKE
ncbi:MAG: hypothetical protein ABEI74_00090 [Candidatus Pacearchaeota archaeon]